MYTYIAQYYDVEDRKIAINDKKIGRTIDLSSRESALNNTKGPIRVFFRKAWNTGDDTLRVEKALHAILDNTNSDGEWFKDDDESLVEMVSNFMTHLGYNEESLSLEIADEETENNIDISNDNLTQQKIISTDSLRKNLHLLVGETFSASRFDIENSITVVKIQDGSIGFKSNLNGKIYNTGGKAWTTPLKEYGVATNKDMGACTINWWLTPKNGKGENPDQVLARKSKTA